MKHAKVGLTFVLILIVLVAAFFGSVYLANKAKQKEMSKQGQDNINSNASKVDPITKGTARTTYMNKQYGFSLEYPEFFMAGVEDFTYLPYGNGQVKTEANFYHEISKPHCDLRGEECEPTTRDLDIGVSVVPESLQSIQNKTYEPLTETNYGAVKTYSLRQGVEGEGIFYAFIPLTTKSTLMIYSSYIDESVVSGYANAPGFITYNEQVKIIEEVYKSIKLIK